MTKIRRGSNLSTFVWWNQPKLKPGDKVKVSKSTQGLEEARKNAPVVGQAVVIAWYYTQGPMRRVVGVLKRVYAVRVWCGVVHVAVVQVGDVTHKVDLQRVSKAQKRDINAKH